MPAASEFTTVGFGCDHVAPNLVQHNVVLLVLLEELRVDLVDVMLARAGAHGEHVGLPRRAFVQ